MAEPWDDPKEEISNMLKSLSSKFDAGQGFEGRLLILMTALIGAVVIARREPGPATTKETSA